MNILGLQFGHDAGAAVLRDGRVASFVLRERLSRIKHALSLDLATIERRWPMPASAKSDIDYVRHHVDPEGRADRPRSRALLRQPAAAPAPHRALQPGRHRRTRPATDPRGCSIPAILDLLYRNAEGDDLLAPSVAHYFPEYRRCRSRPSPRLGWMDTYISADPWTTRPRLRDIAAERLRALPRHRHDPPWVPLPGHAEPQRPRDPRLLHPAPHGPCRLDLLPAGLERAAILCHDGFGSGQELSLRHVLLRRRAPHLPAGAPPSVAGAIYETAGIRLNLGLIGPAGKLMGLAPYGTPKFFAEHFVGNTYDLAAAATRSRRPIGSTIACHRRKRCGYDLRAFRDRDQMTAPINADIAAVHAEAVRRDAAGDGRRLRAHAAEDEAGAAAALLCRRNGAELPGQQPHGPRPPDSPPCMCRPGATTAAWRSAPPSPSTTTSSTSRCRRAARGCGRLSGRRASAKIRVEGALQRHRRPHRLGAGTRLGRRCRPRPRRRQGHRLVRRAAAKSARAPSATARSSPMPARPRTGGASIASRGARPGVPSRRPCSPSAPPSGSKGDRCPRRTCSSPPR